MADLRKQGIVTKVRKLKTGETVGGIPLQPEQNTLLEYVAFAGAGAGDYEDSFRLVLRNGAGILVPIFCALFWTERLKFGRYLVELRVRERLATFIDRYLTAIPGTIFAASFWRNLIRRVAPSAALRQEPRRCSAEAASATRHHRHLVAPFHHFKGWISMPAGRCGDHSMLRSALNQQ
jgi:hypothetical protein